MVLTHVLLQEGGDLDAAERALRDVLALDPAHNEALCNLDLLLRRRTGDAATAPPTSGAARRADSVAAAPPGPPRVAVVSTVHNEEDLIVAFLEHYFGLGAGAIVLLANDCTDRTLELAARFPAASVERLDSGGELDCALRRDALDARRRSLAGRFDWVLLVDADEFLVPKEGGLKETLLRHAGRAVLGSEGWDVVQRPGEPPYDPARPLLRQRRWARPTRHTASRSFCGPRRLAGTRWACTTWKAPSRARRRPRSTCCTSPTSTRPCSSSGDSR